MCFSATQQTHPTYDSTWNVSKNLFHMACLYCCCYHHTKISNHTRLEQRTGHIVTSSLLSSWMDHNDIRYKYGAKWLDKGRFILRVISDCINELSSADCADYYTLLIEPCPSLCLLYIPSFKNEKNFVRLCENLMQYNTVIAIKRSKVRAICLLVATVLLNNS